MRSRRSQQDPGSPIGNITLKD